jgi:hypothetical protein
MLTFDHIAISANSLGDGVDMVEAALGVALAGGGEHPHMATHNRLLGLGDLYLEVIAANPAAPRPAWPRWFDLDNFDGPPRLTNWVASSKIRRCLPRQEPFPSVCNGGLSLANGRSG